MSDREMVSVRLEPDTRRRIENYAEEKDITKSAAMRRLLNKGADLEDAGIAVAASTIENNQETKTVQPEEDEEKDLKADGSGAVVRPLLNIISAFYAVVLLTLFGVLMIGVAGIKFEPIPYAQLIPLTLSISVVIAMIALTLYTSIPERVDTVIRIRVKSVRNKFDELSDPV
jgi:predicted transcriptional regulator